MDQKRINDIIKKIGLSIESEQDAYELISLLVKEDWKWWIENTDPRTRWTEQPCVLCKEIIKCGRGPASGMCSDCYAKYSFVISTLSRHRDNSP